MPLHSYGKIYNLGHAAIASLFDDPVLVEEKIDGSQFSFGIIDGELICKSKGQVQHVEAPDGMFAEAVETAKSLALTPGWTYRTEYLRTPKHNTLAYSRIPDNHLIIFDIDEGDQCYMPPGAKAEEASRIGLECVPALYRGEIKDYNQFSELLEFESILGGTTIEGVVIKNYSLFGRDGKVLMGKFVSEKFKERNSKEFRKNNPTQGDIKFALGMELRAEARWHKAVQHLRERGELTDSPTDIGSLLKEINRDILEECADEMKERLFKWAWKDVGRMATRGFPEWYKEELAKKQFAEV